MLADIKARTPLGVTAKKKDGISEETSKYSRDMAD